jgi:hypothetical protein
LNGNQQPVLSASRLEPKIMLARYLLPRGRPGGTRRFEPGPDFEAVNGYFFVDFEAEPNPSWANVKHGDFEQMLEAIRTSDDHRFLSFPRQDQHAKTSIS